MTTTSIVSDLCSVEGDSSLQRYSCPFCNKFLFRGKVNRLSMVCHNCNKLVVMDSDSSDKSQQDSYDKTHDPA